MAELCITGQQIKFCWPKQSQPTLFIPALEVAKGQRILLRGPSGSGKSTLLSLLAGINQPSSGTLNILGTDLHRLSQRQRDKFRADHIGYIFQQFNLLPYLSVYRNVLLACDFSSARKRKLAALNIKPESECERLLTHLGIDAELWHQQASQLSVGQQQRVAVARALIGKPELIIADEPTSALDTDARDIFLDLLQQECTSAAITLVFVTHDASLGHHFDRIIELSEINQVESKG